MAIEVILDIMLATRKFKGVKFETHSKICDYLECETGDILRHVPDTHPEDCDG